MFGVMKELFRHGHPPCCRRAPKMARKISRQTVRFHERLMNFCSRAPPPPMCYPAGMAKLFGDDWPVSSRPAKLVMCVIVFALGIAAGAAIACGLCRRPDAGEPADPRPEKRAGDALAGQNLGRAPGSCKPEARPPARGAYRNHSPSGKAPESMSARGNYRCPASEGRAKAPARSRISGRHTLSSVLSCRASR
jgi:hypothetical protein